MCPLFIPLLGPDNALPNSVSISNICKLYHTLIGLLFLHHTWYIVTLSTNHFVYRHSHTSIHNYIQSNVANSIVTNYLKDFFLHYANNVWWCFYVQVPIQRQCCSAVFPNLSPPLLCVPSPNSPSWSFILECWLVTALCSQHSWSSVLLSQRFHLPFPWESCSPQQTGWQC